MWNILFWFLVLKYRTEDNTGKIPLQKHVLDYSPPASCCLQNFLKQNLKFCAAVPSWSNINIKVEQLSTIWRAAVLPRWQQLFCDSCKKTIKLQPWSVSTYNIPASRRLMDGGHLACWDSIWVVWDLWLFYHGDSSFSSTAAKKTIKLQPWSGEAADADSASCNRWKHLKLGGLQFFWKLHVWLLQPCLGAQEFSKTRSWKAQICDKCAGDPKICCLSGKISEAAPICLVSFCVYTFSYPRTKFIFVWKINMIFKMYQEVPHQCRK